MNINFQGIGNSFMGGGTILSHRGLKSTEERLKRQETRDRQISFYENQKANLKNMKCDTIEEIAKKLEMFHSYEDSIAAAKAVYNSEQMMHILDEAREKAEKIAEAVEKMEPKTPEERLEDIVEEAMGIEDGGGMLEEVLEEAAQMQEELQKEMQEELQIQEDVQDIQENVQESIQEQLQEQTPESSELQAAAEAEEPEAVDPEKIFIEEQLLSEKDKIKYLYSSVDIRL